MTPASNTPSEPFEIRFGGWYDGDNLGQILAESARREYRKHRCRAVA